MIAPLATLAFLLTLWLSAFVFAEMFGRTGTRILRALRGEASVSSPNVVAKVRAKRVAISYRQPLRARPQLRAAA